MHAIVMLQKWAGQALPDIHLMRLNTLFVAVEGLLRGQQLYLSAVGRNLRSQTSEKHGIKRIDRLLGCRSACKNDPLRGVIGVEK